MAVSNLHRFFGLSLFSFVLALISMFKSRNMRLVDNAGTYTLVYLNRAVHWILFLFNAFYVFIFTREWDGIFLGTLLVTSLHWLWFNNECIVTYWEKWLMDSSYKLGDRPFYHPFAMDTSFHPTYGSRAFFDIIFTLSFVSLSIVLWRLEINVWFKLTYIAIIAIIRIYIEMIRKLRCVRLD